MLTLFLRAILLYVILMLSMRAMGKRQMGQFQPYEFVLVLLIANLVSTPMSNVSTPLLGGLLPVGALFVVHALITLLCMRSDRMRAFLCGKPSVIIERGVIRQEELKKLNLTLSDLMEGLRACGLSDPSQVCTAVMEANGSISAFPHSAHRPPTAGEAGIALPYEGLPLILIMDGRVQIHSLKSGHLTEAWLREQLQPLGLRVQDVFLCSLGTDGRLFVQDNCGNQHTVRAIAPEEVCW